MKSWAFVTTPYAWCVPRSRSLVTTNSVWSTQIVVSGRRSSGDGASTNAGSMFPTAIACSVVADGAREHEGHPVRHEGMHDPRAHEPLPHGGGDAAGAPDLVDGPHVERMAAFDALPRARHAERRPENRRLEIVHRDGVPAAERDRKSTRLN